MKVSEKINIGSFVYTDDGCPALLTTAIELLFSSLADKCGNATPSFCPTDIIAFSLLEQGYYLTAIIQEF